MTALKPLETSLVRGVASERYPLNELCSQPHCVEQTADPHHCFPRSQIGNDSWFVEITGFGLGVEPIPHVTGLCRAHHDDVEEHRAWIKLEEGVFAWYDRIPDDKTKPPGTELFTGTWGKVGALNPQPGSREGKPKRSPHKGEARRARATLSLRVPADQREDGAGLLEDLHAEVEAKLGHNPARPLYYSICDAFNFLLANADETDV